VAVDFSKSYNVNIIVYIMIWRSAVVCTGKLILIFSPAYKKASLDLWLFAVLIFNFSMFAFGRSGGVEDRKTGAVAGRSPGGPGEYRKPLLSIT
jgi:hypothetical protein